MRRNPLDMRGPVFLKDRPVRGSRAGGLTVPVRACCSEVGYGGFGVVKVDIFGGGALEVC